MPLTHEERARRIKKRVWKKIGSHAVTAGVALSLAANVLQHRQTTKLRRQTGIQANALEKLKTEKQSLASKLSEANRRATEATPLAEAWKASRLHADKFGDLTRDARDLTTIAKRRFLTETELIRAGLVLGGLHATTGVLGSSPSVDDKTKASRVKEVVRKLVAELEAKGHMRLVRRTLPPEFGL